MPDFVNGEDYYAVSFHSVNNITVPFDPKTNPSTIPAAFESKGITLAVVADIRRCRHGTIALTTATCQISLTLREEVIVTNSNSNAKAQSNNSLDLNRLVSVEGNIEELHSTNELYWNYLYISSSAHIEVTIPYNV